jgi:hypothetical protein
VVRGPSPPLGAARGGIGAKRGRWRNDGDRGAGEGAL